MPSLPNSSRLRVAVVAFVLALFAMPGAASAHTDFDFSIPTDGASVGSPVNEVTVAFTSPVELVGNGFEALDPQGNVLQPFAVTDDDQVFRLQFDPPLAGGSVGVRYEVRADDGHVLSGSFSFAVDAPVPPTASPTTAPPATTPPPPDPPSTAAPATTAPELEAAEPAPTTSVAATTTTGATPTTVTAGTSSDDGSSLGLILVIAAAAAVGIGGFFLVRSRTSGAP